VRSASRLLSASTRKRWSDHRSTLRHPSLKPTLEVVPHNLSSGQLLLAVRTAIPSHALLHPSDRQSIPNARRFGAGPLRNPLQRNSGRRGATDRCSIELTSAPILPFRRDQRQVISPPPRLTMERMCFSARTAVPGTQVRAPVPGEIVRGDFDHIVAIRGPYGKVDLNHIVLSVSYGQTVQRGDVVGTIASGQGNHVHMELRPSGEKILECFPGMGPEYLIVSPLDGKPVPVLPYFGP
jgi:biotin carboxyl carrier protein